MTTEEKELAKEAANEVYEFIVNCFEKYGFFVTTYKTAYGKIYFWINRADDPGDRTTPPSSTWTGKMEIDEVYSGDHFDVDCAVIMKGIVEELEERFAL